MSEDDYKLWTEIRPKSTVSYYQRTVMAELMTKYYKVRYKVPCACPSTIKELIGLLDKLNDNRRSDSSGVQLGGLEANDKEQQRRGSDDEGKDVPATDKKKSGVSNRRTRTNKTKQ